MDQLYPLTPSERAAQLLADERAESRIRRRDYFVALVGAVGSVAFGLFLIAQAVHTTDVRAGNVLFWAGLLIGDGGWLASMAWVLYRAQQRGELR